jgi:hypothetical protein
MKPLPKTLNHGDAQFSFARENFTWLSETIPVLVAIIMSGRSRGQ